MYLLFKYEYLEWLNEIVLPHYIQPWNKKLLGVFNNLEDAQKEYLKDYYMVGHFVEVKNPINL